MPNMLSRASQVVKAKRNLIDDAVAVVGMVYVMGMMVVGLVVMVVGKTMIEVVGLLRPRPWVNMTVTIGR